MFNDVNNRTNLIIGLIYKITMLPERDITKENNFFCEHNGYAFESAHAEITQHLQYAWTVVVTPPALRRRRSAR